MPLASSVTVFPNPSAVMPSPRRLPRCLRRAIALVAGCLAQPLAVFALNTPNHPLLNFQPSMGNIMELARDGRVASIYVDTADWPGVVRAAGDLQTDIARVTDLTPAITHDAANPGTRLIIVGTIGRSQLIDRLIAEGKIDVSRVRGKWESFLIQGLPGAVPNGTAIVIAGSDKRGTIFGIYDLCEQLGVSPWHWWADVTPPKRSEVYVLETAYVQGEPSVKYRGIFLNDEAPSLTNWVLAKYGTATPSTNPPVPGGIANYGREFYTRIFELLLRMKANYLWPAMWNNAFNEDDPENPRLADEYGIVMGTSHQEPMLRAQKEWDRRYGATLGSWNYATQASTLQAFWREGVRRNRNYESIITMGLRGANDTEMAPGGPEANRALLEEIVRVQRTILADEVNPDVTRVPQVWCLYKEVQDYYEAGMRVPDDVTLLWAEDNWGDLRRVPTADERARPGGAGIYYHFDYHGGPRSYQWINTSPLPKIWDQMALAKQYGADRIWIVNVGHLNKSYELPIEYFLSLGWDAQHWTESNTDDFTRGWAAREFGGEHAAEIADIVTRYTRYNARRKPELLSPTTYSLVNDREAETVVADYNALATRAEAVLNALPASKRDAFYQTVYFAVKSCALVNDLYVTAGRNALYAAQGRASTAAQAARVRELFAQDMALKNNFNTTFAGGRWAHFMDQTHLGYLNWQDPPTDSLRAIPLVEPTPAAAAALGVAIEGSASAWPGTAGQPALPRFDALNRQIRWIEVFNKGTDAFAFTATASAPWIVLSETTGSVGADRRLAVSIDWSAVPAGSATGTVRITGAGAEVTVAVEALNPAGVSRDTLIGFAESAGFVAIEAEHFTANRASGDRHWLKIEDYGHTLSGLRATGPVDAEPAIPGTNAPCLEYQMHTFSTGPANVTVTVGPTLNFLPGRPLRYAISVDDETPHVVTLVPAGYRAQNGNADWEESVRANARFGRSTHAFTAAGTHTLKVWMIDPGVVVQKLLVDFGGARPSYLGPTESYFAPVPPPATVSTAPQSQAVALGSTATLTVEAAGHGPFTYQWQKDGTDLPGATSSTLTLTGFAATDAGLYRVVVTNPGGSVTSAAATVRVGTSRVMNISVRGKAGTGDQTLIMGFVLAGTGNKTVLLRNKGPTLATYGVPGTLVDPELELFRESTSVRQNNDWASETAASPALFARLGAGPLLDGSRDAALVAALPAGVYSAHGRGLGGTTGIALVEAFDADAIESGVRFTNFSVRNQVGVGDEILIVGFVLSGDAPKRFLIRGVGPSLPSDVSGVLPDPELTVYNAYGSPIAENDDWDSSGPLPATFTELGSSPLPLGSHDAALMISVAPGVYSAHVRGADDTMGVALLEVYAMP
ncbi:glycosyl hydrolase 115 family protein [Opitutus terrae]|uniref:Immunoglobulin I-set domain protein n=1 Tax=Opitutus terrae (strain DSM 11246 / JCM 15787 / PB90-1) TaxID=452637 RepID=B1ZYP6_OPITP|nr:glycosyl hydrolase 115 family protein [Opitutus terrae]ACB75282.1 Immunoglobulin I-set domain protein [Opitutus terrae PB90-1]